METSKASRRKHGDHLRGFEVDPGHLHPEASQHSGDRARAL
ncbi:hypothetical protein [Kribbella sp. NPDC006257]